MDCKDLGDARPAPKENRTSGHDAGEESDKGKMKDAKRGVTSVGE
jgi:hypothetical protein